MHFRLMSLHADATRKLSVWISLSYMTNLRMIWICLC